MDGFVQRETEPYDYQRVPVGAPAHDAGPGLLEAMSRFRWLIVAVSVGAAILAYLLSSMQATRYEAQASMLLADPRTSGVFADRSAAISDMYRYVRNQADFVESAAVSARAAELLGTGFSLEDVRNSYSADATDDYTDVVTIRASSSNAQEAAALADAVGEAYQQLVAEQFQSSGSRVISELQASKAQQQARVDAIEAQLAEDPGNRALEAERDAAIAQVVNLDTRIEQIDVNLALYGSGVQYFEAADVPTSPASPRPLRNAAAAAVLGLLGAGAYAWWRTERSPLAETRHDPAPILGAPLLGEVPDFSSVGIQGPAPVIHEPESVAAEAYQFVASSIDYALDQISGSTVLVTSVGAGEGKTVTSLNIAAAATGDGARVLLVDADERARGLTRMGGDRDLKGLTDLIRSNGLDLRDCLVRWKVTDERRVIVLPAGSRQQAASGIFRTRRFQKIMTEIRDVAELVILDSPPILAAAETLDIAGETDGIVLVVEQGTPLQALAEARERLAMVGKPLLGYVFNKATRSSSGYGRYYGYGYGHPS